MSVTKKKAPAELRIARWFAPDDLRAFDKPTLILHGDADRILPPDATSRRQARMIKNVKLVELPGGPHGVLWTHADRINSELLSFLA